MNSVYIHKKKLEEAIEIWGKKRQVVHLLHVLRDEENELFNILEKGSNVLGIEPCIANYENIVGEMIVLLHDLKKVKRSIETSKKDESSKGNGALKESVTSNQARCGNCKYFWDGLCTKHRTDDLAQRKPDDFCSFDFEQKG